MLVATRIPGSSFKTATLPGAGADIVAVAISQILDAIADMLLLTVHDELLFKVPAFEVEITK